MSIIEKAVGGTGRLGADKSSGEVREKSTSVHRAGNQPQENSRMPAGDSAVHSRPDTLQRTASSGRMLNIPFDELRREGMLTPSAPRSVIADEYRNIKRPLLRNINGQGAADIEFSNLIMVTSAIQGDGKTFSSINLALSIAMEMDKTVLFVDADVARANAGEVLGVPADSPGLIEVLERPDVSVEDVVYQTNMEKLTIMPAGRPHANANELLASEAMRKLMHDLSRRYTDRVVVFDSPPLLLTTEAAVLASFVGQIVFVVKADTTPQHAVSEAIEQIGEDKAIGLVFNRAQRSRFNRFGMGYGYGYGQGYGAQRRGAMDNNLPVSGT
ncbi:MAG: XrtA-associated tyrosine autokinase [Parahaliea sp.]